MRSVLPHAIALAILCGILTAGLWPFHAPRNQVTWLDGVPGLGFGEYASIVTGQPFPSAPPVVEHTVEIWLEARNLADSNTFLTFYDPQCPVRFALKQSGTDVIVERSLGLATSDRRSRIYLPDAFARSQPVLVTIVAGRRGTAGYLNGRLTRSSPNLQFESNAFAGRLLIGNSPFKDDSWGGRLLGVAIYDRSLTEAEVARHCESWTSRGIPDSDGDAHPIALYLFDEKHGDIAHSRVPGAPDLLIPYRYGILNEVLLQPFWQEVNSTWGFWKNVVINIGGFIPFGLVFRGYLSSSRKNRRVVILAIGLGFLVSLTIEVSQGFLPTRQSGTTDLITNTLGTAIGAGLYSFCPTFLRNLLCRYEIARQVPVATL